MVRSIPFNNSIACSNFSLVKACASFWVLELSKVGFMNTLIRRVPCFVETSADLRILPWPWGEVEGTGGVCTLGEVGVEMGAYELFLEICAEWEFYVDDLH